MDDNVRRRLTQEQLEALKEDRTSYGRVELRDQFGYHKPGEVPQEIHKAVRNLFMDFGEIFDRMLPPGEAKYTAFQRLVEASMWAHKAVAQMSPVVDD